MERNGEQQEAEDRCSDGWDGGLTSTSKAAEPPGPLMNHFKQESIPHALNTWPAHVCAGFIRGLSYTQAHSGSCRGQAVERVHGSPQGMACMLNGPACALWTHWALCRGKNSEISTIQFWKLHCIFLNRRKCASILHASQKAKARLETSLNKTISLSFVKSILLAEILAPACVWWSLLV